jgi:hypothetical protein
MADDGVHFATRKAALKYATERGYRLGYTRFCEHVKAGLVPNFKKGDKIRVEDMVAYLASHGDASEMADTVTGKECSAELDRLFKIKKNKKADLDIESKELENRREDSKWISRGDADRNLISFAVLLDAQFDQMINTRSQELVALVGGDDAKRGEFVAMLREIKDAVFNNVAEGDETEVDL